jgi:hypothetical protein
MHPPWVDEWQDYYRVMGLPESFTADQLKAAYRLRAKRWHPDTSALPADEARRRFLILRQAFEVLSSPPLLSAYRQACEDRKIPACAFPGCGRKTREVCSSCGRPACTLHLHAPEETGGRFSAPGRYCRACLPHCSRCGALCMGATPPSLQGVEALLRAFDPTGRWCADCLADAPPLGCSHPGCPSPAAEPCAHCGKPACGAHLAPEHQTGGRFTRPGRYCHQCLPKCSSCGEPATGRLSRDQRSAEAVLRQSDPRGAWCGPCLERAKVFACSGCGRSGFALADLRSCPSCKKHGLCPDCLPGGGAGFCLPCGRVTVLEAWYSRTRGAASQAMALSLPVAAAGLAVFDLWLLGSFSSEVARGDEGAFVTLLCIVLGGISIFGVTFGAAYAALMILLFPFEWACELVDATGKLVLGISVALVRTIGYGRPFKEPRVARWAAGLFDAGDAYG